MIWAGGEKRPCLQCNHELCQAGPQRSKCVCVYRQTYGDEAEPMGRSPPGYLLTVLLTVMSTEQVGWDTQITKLGHLRGGAEMRQWQIVERSSTPRSSDEEARRAPAYTHILQHSRSNLETQTRTAACSALFSLRPYPPTPGAIRQIRP